MLSKLRWLIEQQNLPLYDYVAEEAAKAGSMELMQWLRSKEVRIGSEVLHTAAVGNHLPLAQYLFSIGTPWHAYMADKVAEKGCLDMLKWLHSQECVMGFNSLAFPAARGGHVNILKWLTIEHGVDLSDNRAMAVAARAGHISVMVWLMEQGCAITADVCEAAVHGSVGVGSVAVFDWLRDFGHFISRPELYHGVISCTASVAAHSLMVMKWLKEVAEFPWDAAELAKYAAVYGKLECLQYIHQHGGPFTAEQLTDQLHIAGQCVNISTAQWLRTQGAPWPTADRLQYAWFDRVMEWARSVGYTDP